MARLREPVLAHAKVIGSLQHKASDKGIGRSTPLDFQQDITTSRQANTFA
jgi:hypothetical protein